VYPQVSDTLCRNSQYQLLNGNTFLFACACVKSRARRRAGESGTRTFLNGSNGDLLLHHAIRERWDCDPGALEHEVDCRRVLVDVISNIWDGCVLLSRHVPRLHTAQHMQ
jgi:hypothetical protein